MNEAASRQVVKATVLVSEEGTKPSEPPRRLHSYELLGGAKEVEIAHDGRIYRLRVTQLNKLILTA
jgi:hemin uptake protein HemP